MRGAVAIGTIVVALAGRAAADPVHDFAAKWPKVAHALSPALARILFEGAPCGAAHPGAPVGDATAATVSPDGKTLVVIAPFELDAAGDKLFGVQDADRVQPDAFAVVFDARTGAWWPRILIMWQACSDKAIHWTWSDDSRRLLATIDAGLGTDVALLDARGHKLIAAGADNLVLPSPHLAHLAYTEAMNGTRVDDKDSLVYGTELLVDGEHVWGAGSPGAADVWGVEWKSDSRLELCGKTPKLAAARYRAEIGGKPVVTRGGDARTCPMRD